MQYAIINSRKEKEMEDLFKRSHWTATKTLCLMKEGQHFGVAYNIAFNSNSGLYPYEYHEARIAVKTWHRQWKATKTLQLAGAEEMAEEANERECPLV
ncbi:MAG: hypothetical protein UR80_C0008G0009 [Parcubacteria group bacterium GW2011_GWB1_35_5]|nr:MAG: hypothetical protein UR50_C0008G0011 [Parcubacteria group bacterium GW2011_GWC1_34_10]KKP81134.1 MAG: hypothetical protein UR80_C0008G0009 [Parcubacteria group bacterium GW2011_GWB1_35_5]